MKATTTITSLLALALFAGPAQAATITTKTWTTGTDTTSQWLSDSGSSATWTVNSGVTATLGDNVSEQGRLFVGINGNDFVLTVTSSDGGGILNLFGHHPADAVIGRLGNGGETGTLLIDGGVSVIGGTNPMGYFWGVIQIDNGLVDFSDGGFVNKGGSLTINIADNDATLIVPGQIDDATDFSTTWSNASVAASGSNPLEFSYDSGNDETTITAGSEDPVDPVTPVLTAFTYAAATGASEVRIVGTASTAYKLAEADDLDFGNPTQEEIPLTQTPTSLPGTVTGTSVVTTDANGDATVQFNLGTKPASFIRAVGTATP